MSSSRVPSERKKGKCQSAFPGKGEKGATSLPPIKPGMKLRGLFLRGTGGGGKRKGEGPLLSQKKVVAALFRSDGDP